MPALRVKDLKKGMVKEWLDEDYAERSANKRTAAVRSIMRSFHWALDDERVDSIPIGRIKTERPAHRELVLDKAAWGKLLALLENKHGKNYDDFRDYLTVIWETGCRPQEIRLVEAKYFERENRRWVFPKEKSKGKKMQRVVYLNDEAFAICERHAALHPTGQMFRQQSGTPWDRNAVRCKFRRLKIQMGLKELCAYTLRHSWATRMLVAGVDSHVVAKLMGHRHPIHRQTTFQVDDPATERVAVGIARASFRQLRWR
ncbi:MAG: tyrosine-type recombinase/integrase [Planctomycetia bacterium]|nr:tyrosine-type recombinase/integrase [Planctomycetia bacterium]